MSAESLPIDQQIAASYQSASEVETQARQLEAGIAQIDGAKRHLPARRYGQPVDLQKIRRNLTLTSLIAQDSAELAHFCGINPGIRHKIDQEREAQQVRHAPIPVSVAICGPEYRQVWDVGGGTVCGR